MIGELRSAARSIDAGLRFIAGTPRLLSRQMGLDEARAAQQRWQNSRDEDFLDLARRALFAVPGSPYLQLLERVGCQLGDLERLVRRDGLEGALLHLYQQGVYLTAPELKGRQPIVRGSTTVRYAPELLRNRQLSGQIVSQTGGSSGARFEVPFDFASVRERAVSLRLLLHALGGDEWQMGIHAVPGGGSIGNILEYLVCGFRFDAWFWRIDPRASGLHPQYRWSSWALRFGALLAGRPLPPPRFVPRHRPLRLVAWLTSVLRRGQTPYLLTTPSSAVVICATAGEVGADLRGARFLLFSEPLTAARRRAIETAGATVIARYASTECRPIAYGCQAPVTADDLHLLHELQVAVQPGDSPVGGVDGPGLPPRALLFTSLRRTAPLILLNVSLGDQALMTRRTCGCPLERLGWTTHLQDVRSFEKLTSGGMTFLDTDVVHVLEEVLPGRFGGGPADYQLVEEENLEGRPVLRLLAHPDIGPLDEQAVIEAFLEAIGSGQGVQHLMALDWRDGRYLRLDRRPPLATVADKVQHLHLRR